MFIKLGSEFRLVSGNPSDIKMELEPGVYNISLVPEGWSKHLHFKKTDRYKNTNMLGVGVFKKVEQHINNFLSKEMYEARKAVNSLNKMGLLFSGEPGTGKTFLAGQIGQKLADTIGAIAIITTDFSEYDLPKLVDSIKADNPERFVVVIMDEFEKCNPRRLETGELLGYLDGNTSRDGVLNLALVNAKSDMKNFLLKRPGRFEANYDFDERDDLVIAALVKNMAPSEYIERLDINFITKFLIETDRRTVDCINIAIRDAIAEILYFDNYGFFKSFNNVNKDIKQKRLKNEIVQETTYDIDECLKEEVCYDPDDYNA